MMHSLMLSLLKRVAVGAACLAAVAASAGHAAAETPSLFKSATPADVSAAAASDARPKGLAQVREQLLALDADVANALDRTGEVKIALFPNAAATFKRTDVDEAYGGGFIWVGEAGSTGAATLVVQNGKITGYVRLRGRSYEIAGVGGRAHRVVEIAADKLPPEGPITVPKELQGGKDDGIATPDELAAAKDDKTTTIKVNIHFTATATSDPIGDGNLAIALANQAYKASGVKIKAKFVAYSVISYPENSYTWDQTLSNMTYTDQPGSAYFNDMRAGREQFKADLVVLIHSRNEYCGLGWYVTKPSAATSGLGYSLVSRDCITNKSVAHEMGHNMGLDHDRYVAGKAPKSAYNFGFVVLNKRIRSIMAYDNKCNDKGFTCERLNRFSSPDDKVQGEKFGVPKGKSGAADAARRLNETREAISKYR
ncbi:zinc-dependent metalloprotease family protein [Chelatococcus sambhunathii]|nr:zinc-dependent metalloprotease family protein [Chelatococcus sambhunathii]